MNTKKWVPQWSFGDRLRKVRTELGMDQREFATKLQIKAPTLSSYEAGRANPRARDLPGLASRLQALTGVPREWFLGWDDENGPASEETRPLLTLVHPPGLEPGTHWLRADMPTQLHPRKRNARDRPSSLHRSTGPKGRAS